MMRKAALTGAILGIVITAVLTASTARLNWDEGMAICPGIPFETTAVLSAGFPVRYNVSTISAMGTCGVITSPLAPGDRLHAVTSPLGIINAVFWISSSILAAMIIVLVRKHILAKK